MRVIMYLHLVKSGLGAETRRTFDVRVILLVGQSGVANSKKEGRGSYELKDNSIIDEFSNIGIYERTTRVAVDLIFYIFLIN